MAKNVFLTKSVSTSRLGMCESFKRAFLAGPARPAWQRGAAGLEAHRWRQTSVEPVAFSRWLAFAFGH